jgi:hypothetical protein
MENFLSRFVIKNAPRRCEKSESPEKKRIVGDVGDIYLYLPSTDNFKTKQKKSYASSYRQRIYSNPKRHEELKARDRKRKMEAKLRKLKLKSKNSP